MVRNIAVMCPDLVIVVEGVKAWKYLWETKLLAEEALLAGCHAFLVIPPPFQRNCGIHGAKCLNRTDLLQAKWTGRHKYGLRGTAAGKRVMTSSGPGISLKQEGISFLAELNADLIVNISQVPSLGGIQPAQSDYFQAPSRRRPWRLPHNRGTIWSARNDGFCHKPLR